MTILHQFSIETAYEPCLTHIIYQTIINIDIRIQYGAVEIIDYSFFTIEPIFKFFFFNFSEQGILPALVRPHSLIMSSIISQFLELDLVQGHTNLLAQLYLLSWRTLDFSRLDRVLSVVC
jgi:hypothetical protein